MQWIWLLVGLAFGFLFGFWVRVGETAIENGQLLVDRAVQYALIKALLGVCEPYHDDTKVAAVTLYVEDSLERLGG